MDQAFLEYYEEELSHIRSLAQEFSALHPNVARNLSMESIPCPDPYVERLLEGVAFLAARTRLKVDGEASRYVRNLIDTLYPDLAGPAPAMTMATMTPGPQVQRMLDGHVMTRGTRLMSGLREGQQTRCVYTTAQPVHLWPVQIGSVSYLQDKGALAQAGVGEGATRDAAAGIRITLKRQGAGRLAELSLDQLDLYFGAGTRGGAIFDAVFGFGTGTVARPADATTRFRQVGAPGMIGIDDAEALLPRVRSSFEGYRLLREYFLMPERFYFLRLDGLAPVIRASDTHDVEIVVLLRNERPDLSGIAAQDFRLFATPVVNLFEHECNIVELRNNRPAHIVQADRTRPRDYEIYRLLRVEDAETDGAQARVTPLFSTEAQADSGHVYSADRRPRRPDTEEVRRGQTRSSYVGDDFYLSVGRPTGARAVRPLRRLDVRALCTNRDLPILDDMPVLTLDSGDPVQTVTLLGPMRRPRPSLRASLPSGATGERQIDDLTWRWISQLSLNHISLAGDEAGAEPLRALLKLYADRGDPALRRHGTSVVRLRSRPVVERLQVAGPLCFGHGTEITLDINEGLLSGGSSLLLSALLARLFARHSAINSFVCTRTQLTQQQTEVRWPMTPGTRALI
ncbi:type VI secretion system baseplate subunit TssF [Puniceibacterium sp. IMCC21224]|uniref:type VI secretion system baseplate subunit TssF n=1 Tax=Puniceibacterium sp. IMCC21224 TaxID=1618204 RepID=UPI00064DD8BA|nr:type VI secretion system baseplate subunit TssF [Puniceibacterium sp. IMCC21224]KMK65233.1 type VI secretion protein, VC_A0110 family [Puniceibacterium sp. IMCC21224]